MTSREGNPLRGVLLMVLASASFATMGMLVKVACKGLPSAVVVFARSAVLVPLAWMLMRHRGVAAKIVNRRVMLLRCVTGFVAMLLYFYALGQIPLATAVTLQYSSPLFVALFSGLLLHERVPVGTVLCIVAAFFGAALILAPDLMRLEFDSLVALGSAMLAAFAYLAVRDLRRTDPPETIVLYFGLFAVVFASPSLAFVEVWPSGSEWLALVGVGAFAFGGQIFMTHAYRHGRAAFVSAFSYATVLVSAVYGGLVFHEPLTVPVALGGLLIVGSGVALSVLEVRRGRRAPATSG